MLRLEKRQEKLVLEVPVCLSPVDRVIRVLLAEQRRDPVDVLRCLELRILPVAIATNHTLPLSKIPLVTVAANHLIPSVVHSSPSADVKGPASVAKSLPSADVKGLASADSKNPPLAAAKTLLSEEALHSDLADMLDMHLGNWADASPLEALYPGSHIDLEGQADTVASFFGFCVDAYSRR